MSDVTGNTVKAAAFGSGVESGELERLIRDKDWSKTPLGPQSGWSQSLKTVVSIMLASRQPIWVGWGPELIYLYNDAYKAIIGGKHPDALGLPTSEVWREIWREIGPMLATASSGTTGTYVEAQLLIMERNGYPEETYYTFSYTPIPGDDGRNSGIFCANTDDTQRVIGARQLKLLRDVSTVTTNAQSWVNVCRESMEAISAATRDVPFALLYLDSGDHQGLSLRGSAGFSPDAEARLIRAGQLGADPWRIREALAAGEAVRWPIEGKLGCDVPSGAWDTPPTYAVTLPIAVSGERAREGALVVGLNPYRLLNEDYKGFLSLLAGQIAAGIGAAEALEGATQRADSLAELDRAKTTFFSNVSHELRTPLTLMLGPIEELLDTAGIDAHSRAQLELAQRNSLRLLKLVNSLLDFSRIEAGRAQAALEPTDLGRFTEDLASAFRSAIERAGLLYEVVIDARGEMVNVDRAMWEKVVLNLLSNALKFTLQGSVRVRLSMAAREAVLEVEDTGVGIPEEEMPRLFERFHRIEGVGGRTQEGTGIGLALVQELVKLHHGSIEATSRLGHGTRFLVRIPRAQKPVDSSSARLAVAGEAPAAGTQAYLQEALGWVSDTEPQSPGAQALVADGPVSTKDSRFAEMRGARIVLADDNADMRRYVASLLSASYAVEPVADGFEALKAIRRDKPELVLSDVMMPRVDGFELIEALRGDANLRDVPVILISARAGEEARIEGLDAGADDYLVKPFAARELLARVGAMLERERLRRAAYEQERLLRLEADAARERLSLALSSITDQFYVLDGAARFVLANKQVADLLGITDQELLGKSLFQLFPELRHSPFPEQLAKTQAEGRPTKFEFFYGPWGRWYESRLYPTGDGVAVLVSEITERKRLQGLLHAQRLALEMALTGATDAEVFHLLARTAQTQLAVDRGAAIHLLNADQSRIRVVATSGLPEHYAAAMESLEITPTLDVNRLPLNEFQVVDLSDAASRNLTPDALALAKERDAYCYWSHPIQFEEGHVFGSLVLYHREPCAPSADVRNALAVLSNTAALILERTLQAGRRKHTEEALSQREAQFAALLEQAPLGVFIIDARFRLSDLNSTAAGLLGAREAVMGRDLEALLNTLWSAANAQSIVQAFRSTLATGVPYVASEWVERRADTGVLESYDWRVHRIPLPNGGSGLVCYFRDISSHVENRLRLEKADRQKNEFLAMLAHELRNPLAPIRNAGEILARTTQQGELAKKATDILQRQVTHLTRLVDDLLDVSRITQGRIELQRHVVQLAEIVAQAVETVDPLLKERNHYISVQTTNGIRVHGDPARLLQSIVNVLTNAAKYTDMGGQIRVEVFRADAMAKVTISDNGYGISPDMLDTIFELFVQSQRTLDRAQGGLGIGLSVVRRLIEMHGGTVTAFSPGLGKGSTFEISLPLATASEELPIEDQMVRSKPLRVLVVDDNEDAARSLGLLLEMEGHQVDLAFSAHAALSLIEAAVPEVVLLDIGLPEVNGFEVASRIRSQTGTANVRVIALTGYGQEEDKKRAWEVGFDGYLVKPVDLMDVRQAFVSTPYRYPQR